MKNTALAGARRLMPHAAVAVLLCLVLPLIWVRPGAIAQTSDYNNPIHAQRAMDRAVGGWDPDNLGSDTVRQVPLVFPYLAFWRGLSAIGASPSTTQRAWMGSLVLLTLISAWSLAIVLIPGNRRLGWTAWAGVFAYAFNPFTLTYWAIGHTVAYLAYAAAPLWLAMLLRALRDGPGWKSGFIPALVSLLFASSFSNPAIVVTIIVVPTFIFGIIEVIVRRTTFGHAVATTASIAGWFILLHAWWIIPAVGHLASGARYEYAGSSSSVLDWPNLANRVPFREFLRGFGYWGIYTGYRGVPYFPWATTLAHPIVVMASLVLLVTIPISLILARRHQILILASVILALIAIFF